MICNLDDATGEEIGGVVTSLMAHEGCRDAWAVPGVGKKGRPMHVLSALCDPSATRDIAEIMVRETPTLGVRVEAGVARWSLPRRVETRAVPIGGEGRTYYVRVKVATWGVGGEVVNEKAEWEDVRRVAREAGVLPRAVGMAAVAAEVRENKGDLQ